MTRFDMAQKLGNNTTKMMIIVNIILIRVQYMFRFFSPGKLTASNDPQDLRL